MSRPGMMTGCNARKPGVQAPLLLAKYLGPELPPAPEKVYREYKIPGDAWGMFANDRIGDCTCAEIAHMLMLVTAHTGTLVIPDEKDVIEFYSAVSQYNPVTGENDNGADLPTVLDRWRDVGLCGHKILQWADVDPRNIENQKHAIHIFAGLDDAVQLPNSAMQQAREKKPWDVVAHDGGIDGGHSILRAGYGSEGATCVTWGALQQESWEWLQKYLFECCAVITKDWLNNADGLTPSGFDLDTLVADLKMLS